MRVCLLGPFHTVAIEPLFRISDQIRSRQFPGMGGYSIVALAQARRSLGLATCVITLDPRAERIEVFHGDGLDFVVCPRRLRGMIRDGYARERAYLREAIRMSKADVIHANWTFEYALAALDSGSPCLVTVRDHTGRMLIHQNWRCWLDSLRSLHVLRRAPALTAVSPGVAAFAGRIRGQEVPVIPNCPSPSLTVAPVPDLCRTEYVIASAISSARFKNAWRALQAFAIVREQMPGARYVVMGPGLGADDPLAVSARRGGLADGVDFLGNVDHAAVLDVFSKSDVVFHPSLQEACSNVLLEGMALGRIVVAGRNCPDCAWAIGDGRAGVLMDARSPADMAQTLLAIRANDLDLEDIRGSARALINERYAPTRIAQQYESQLEQALISQHR